MIKDSALVSVLGVADITQLGKVYAAGSFRFFETYNVVAFLYLVMTVGLSLPLRGAGAPPAQPQPAPLAGLAHLATGGDGPDDRHLAPAEGVGPRRPCWRRRSSGSG